MSKDICELCSLLTLSSIFLRTDVLNVLTKRSGIPLDAVWNEAVLRCLVPKVEQNFSKTSEVNCGPLSLKIAWGIPSIEKIAHETGTVSCFRIWHRWYIRELRKSVHAYEPHWVEHRPSKINMNSLLWFCRILAALISLCRMLIFNLACCTFRSCASYVIIYVSHQTCCLASCFIFTTPQCPSWRRFKACCFK